MRSAMIVANKKLQMLQQEQICEQVSGVWNLSSDQVRNQRELNLSSQFWKKKLFECK